MIHHLAPNGKIGLVLANGALSSQSSGEGEIRKKIIQADLVEGIVALPTQLFYSVTIPVTLWFISKDKKQKGKTLFIDARKMGYYEDIIDLRMEVSYPFLLKVHSTKEVAFSRRCDFQKRALPFKLAFQLDFVPVFLTFNF